MGVVDGETSGKPDQVAFGALPLGMAGDLRAKPEWRVFWASDMPGLASPLAPLSERLKL